MTSYHITVGTSDDLDEFRNWMRQHPTVTWPIPKSAKVGDKILFLIPAHVGQIVASGTVQTIPVPSERWVPKYQAAIADIHFRPNPIPIELLQQRLPDWKYLTYARSYVTVPDQFVSALEEILNLERRFDVEAGVLPEEEFGPYHEGAVRQVTVNAYERDPDARRCCIQHYGTTCCVCGFNFGVTYGTLGEGFIHVHHLKPLSEIGEEHQVNPLADLRPVCPNCHAMLHRRTPAYSIEELQQVLQRKRSCELA